MTFDSDLYQEIKFVFSIFTVRTHAIQDGSPRAKSCTYIQLELKGSPFELTGMAEN